LSCTLQLQVHFGKGWRIFFMLFALFGWPRGPRPTQPRSLFCTSPKEASSAPWIHAACRLRDAGWIQIGGCEIIMVKLRFFALNEQVGSFINFNSSPEKVSRYSFMECGGSDRTQYISESVSQNLKLYQDSSMQRRSTWKSCCSKSFRYLRFLQNLSHPNYEFFIEHVEYIIQNQGWARGTRDGIFSDASRSSPRLENAKLRKGKWCLIVLKDLWPTWVCFWRRGVMNLIVWVQGSCSSIVGYRVYQSGVWSTK
jgi:hypothetical protein